MTVIAIANAASVRIGIRVSLTILWRHSIRVRAFFHNLNIERIRFMIITVRYHCETLAINEGVKQHLRSTLDWSGAI